MAVDVVNFEKLTDIIQEFLNNLSLHHLSENTYRSYARDLQQLLSFVESRYEKNHERSLKVTISEYVDYLRERSLHRASQARKISCLNSFLKFLRVKSYIETDLFFRRPAITYILEETIPYERIIALLQNSPAVLNTAYPYRDTAILGLLATTGICCSELINLRVRDISLDRQELYIRSGRSKERAVPFSFFAYETVYKMKQYLEHERLTISDSYEAFFLNHRNRPLTCRSIQRICAAFRIFDDQATVLTPRHLRHAYAVQLLKAGTSIADAQALLGHSTLVSTEKYLAFLALVTGSEKIEDC
jgi:site-specific recombinase XerD